MGVLGSMGGVSSILITSIVFEKKFFKPMSCVPLMLSKKRDSPARLPVQQGVVGGHVPLQLAPASQQVLPSPQLLLGVGARLPELRLQPADHRAQALQLQVVPVPGVLQGVLQASFLQESEHGQTQGRRGGPRRGRRTEQWEGLALAWSVLSSRTRTLQGLGLVGNNEASSGGQTPV